MKLGRDVERLSGGRLGSGRIPDADGHGPQGYLFWDFIRFGGFDAFNFIYLFFKINFLLLFFKL